MRTRGKVKLRAPGLCKKSKRSTHYTARRREPIPRTTGRASVPSLAHVPRVRKALGSDRNQRSRSCGPLPLRAHVECCFSSKRGVLEKRAKTAKAHGSPREMLRNFDNFWQAWHAWGLVELDAAEDASGLCRAQRTRKKNGLSRGHF
jgi:hypothetical protein